MEHPFYGSWGYQTTGYFAPTSRYGTPQDFMYLIDHLHQHGIGVILDWVPSHFPTDEHGLGVLRRHAPLRARRPAPGLPPRLGQLHLQLRPPRGAQLPALAARCSGSSTYHIDGLRVDAVASMLYLDYSRKAGEWIPNHYGGRENLEAIDFLRRLNEDVYRALPGRADHRRGVDRLADGVAADVRRRARLRLQVGHGLDARHAASTCARDPIHRKYHHNELTFRDALRLHRELRAAAVARRGRARQGLAARQDAGRRLAEVRQPAAALRLQYAQPGKKLLFMGGELGQWREWNHDASLDWHLLDEPAHARRRSAGSRDLNALYRDEPALHELDCDPAGFEWIDCRDAEAEHARASCAADRGAATRSWSSLQLHAGAARTTTASACRGGGCWHEVLNSDAESTAAAAWATSAASRRRRRRARAPALAAAVAAAAFAAVFFRPAPTGMEGFEPRDDPGLARDARTRSAPRGTARA